MDDEGGSFDSMYVCIDIKKAEKFPIFIKNVREKLDLINGVDINLKALNLSLNDLIVVEYSSDEEFSGVLAEISGIEKHGEMSVRLTLNPIEYVKITKRIDFNAFAKVKVSAVVFIEISNKSEEPGILSALYEEFEEYQKHTHSKNFNDLIYRMNSDTNVLLITDLIVSIVEMDYTTKFEMITERNIKLRAKKVLVYLSELNKVFIMRDDILKEVAANVSENQKKYYLNEQLKIIKKELGYSGNIVDEYEDLKSQISKAKMTDEVEKRALAELAKLSSMAPMSPEATVIRNYLDWLINIPWEKRTKDNLDINLAEKILNKNHFGLDKIKERILESLAVIKLSNQVKGQILCLVGPPGVGKTSLGQSIAEAMGRKFVRMSLGGVRDEAEIRGHRKTYIGSMPGRIIQMMKRSGVLNPVFMLDEVDKLGSDFKGDPSSALLEVLDSEINHAFTDHYLEVDYDLSNVLFICTANVIHTIPPALRDRMEIINLPGYLDFEKYEICKRFLISKTMKMAGLKKSDISIDNEAIKEIIKKYTVESGVRTLEKTVSKIMRKRAKEIASETKLKDKNISVKSLTKYLGSPIIIPDGKDKKSLIGVAKGLAWTSYGGATMSIETLIFDGSGKIQLTGQLGDVMKESANASISYLRKYSSQYKIEKDFFQKYDIHIHVPEGAIPKDGPSAGITITMSLFSALSKKPLRNDFAMTGEITLRGIILPIGGLQEKIVAAQSAGINNVIIPYANKPQFLELPQRVKKNIKIYFIERIEDAIRILFG